MKILIILVFLLSVNISKAQEIDQIMRQDTVYVKFKLDKDQTKYFKNENPIWHGYNFLKVFFLSKDTRGILQYDSDFKTSYKKADVRYEKRCFLRKHKHEIIDISFFKKLLKNSEQYDVMNKIQIFYIIDKDDYEKNKIKLIEVDPFVVIEH